jgi:DNA-binding transcriptional LysR family regulator
MIVGYHEDLAGESELEIQPLFNEPFRPICRADHPLQKFYDVSLEQLQAYPWASTFIPRKLRSLYIERLGPRVFESQYMFQCDNFGVIFQLLRHSDHISFVTDSMIKQETETGELAFLPSPFDMGMNCVGIISMSKRSFSPSAQMFCQYLRDHVVD